MQQWPSSTSTTVKDRIGIALSSVLLSSTLADGCLIQRGAQSACEFDSVVVGPEMHEDQPWLLVQHVAVDGRNLYPGRRKLLDDGVHLGADQHEVSGDRRLTAAGRLEADC